MAFAAGVWLVLPWRRREAAGAFAVYVGALALMAIALYGAVGLDWSHLSTATQAVFAALCGLAAVMVCVAARARAVSAAASVDQVGFTLIALFDGFAIITALDAGAPGWAVAVVGVLGVMIGRRAVSYARSRSSEAAAQPGPPVNPEQETTVTQIDATVTVAAEPDRLWREIGSFQGVGRWHPWLRSVHGNGESPGSIRIASAGDSEPQVERLLAVDPDEHFYRYKIESIPMPVTGYVGEFRVRPGRAGTSTVQWSASFDVTSESADPEAMVGDFLRAGLLAIERSYQ